MKEKINLTIETATKEMLKTVSESKGLSMSQFVDDLVREFYDENWMELRPSYIEKDCNQVQWNDGIIPSELLAVQNEIERLEQLKVQTNKDLDSSIFFLRKMFFKESSCI